MQPTISPATAPPKPLPAVETRTASRGSRFFAAVVDLAALLTVYLIAHAVSAPMMFFLGVPVVIALQFYVLTVRGQTIGKIVMNIRIVDIHSGDTGGFVSAVLLRTVLTTALWLVPPYLLVDLLFIFRDDRRCIHDLIAGTKVVETELP